MLTWNVTISDLFGVSCSHEIERVGLLEAVHFGECRVVEALQTVGLAPETPIFLQVFECGSEAPSFYLARYGTSEDLPPFFVPCLPITYVHITEA